MKKAFGLLVIACLLALCGLAASESLASPGNVHWKEGSTATAVWDAVEGANYYQVEVHVYHDGEEIGYAETGTTDCEADVQAQINMIVNNAQYV